MILGPTPSSEKPMSAGQVARKLCQARVASHTGPEEGVVDVELPRKQLCDAAAKPPSDASGGGRGVDAAEESVMAYVQLESCQHR